MMKYFRHTLATLAAIGVMAGTGFSPAQAQTLEKIKDSGQMSIGMLVDFPPYGILNEQNQPDGYDADVAKLLAEDMGAELTLVPVTGPNRIPYLLGGRVDLLVASLGITPDRAKRVDYSEPYAAIVVYLYGQTDIDIPDAEAMQGKTIGVARGSTQDVAVTNLAPEGATIQRFPSDAAAVQALLAGQVQAVGVSGTVIHHIEQRAPDRFDKKFVLREQVQSIAFRPGDDELRARVNEFLGRVKENGKLDEVHQKWLDSPLPDVLYDYDKEIPHQ
ncbi:polar amino acid transport system substrate-binding protein [Modicisalibacter muralis]|uniref:Polar amino acid transport system substrate-binding protein n=1 Tax=Modicisalibacter muralis TaxID=119000 RepID=A0A1G9N3L6_9GAMM|nr:transporter substrate-binding domain-containing protein [Halomonas muralis]SDL81166.1 polar amino acid transport system substrate-binding protein [Halomonas muralis]